jgi:hypothetical protein
MVRSTCLSVVKALAVVACVVVASGCWRHGPDARSSRDYHEDRHEDRHADHRDDQRDNQR